MGELRPAEPPAPPRADAATATALVVAAVLPSLVMWWYFIVLAGPQCPELLRTAVYAGGKVAQFALPLAFVLLWERRRPWPSRPRRDGLLLGFGFGLAVAVGLLALYFGWLRDSPLLAKTATPVLTVLRGFGVATLPGFLALAASLTVVNSLFEEYYFRWFVFGRMRAFMPLPAAVVLSALVFMAHHVILLSVYLPGQFWTLAVPLSLCVACGGGLWAWLYARTGSVYAPWLSHAVIDAAVLAVGWDLLRRGG